LPELPEVETIRSDLVPLLTGKRILSVWVADDATRLLPHSTPELFALSVAGSTIEALARRGKYLVFTLSPQSSVLSPRFWIVHLRMTGRLLCRAASDPPDAYVRALVTLDDGHELRWSDLRKFGTWELADSLADLERKLGPEPLGDMFTVEDLQTMLLRRKAPVKAVLLDQKTLAGLGNIYVDEALYEAGVDPRRVANSVELAETTRLHAAIRSVLEQGVANRGASFSDYADASGAKGSNQLYVRVFRRTGKPCYTCGAMIERCKTGGRSTHFCPVCQK
jgi:formamidopyrimidine-DNA glycosylase